jgi:exonuclease III
MSKEGFGGGKWRVIGDFNSVLLPDERRGVNEESSSNLEVRGFRDFLEEVDLVDLPLLGRSFTWYHANGVAMSSIDRGWGSLEWIEEWGDCWVWVCPRGVSDHCPLVLKYAENDWGPKSFRFNNYWLDHKDFKKVVEDCWRG